MISWKAFASHRRERRVDKAPTFYSHLGILLNLNWRATKPDTSSAQHYLRCDGFQAHARASRSRTELIFKRWRRLDNGTYIIIMDAQKSDNYVHFCFHWAGQNFHRNALLTHRVRIAHCEWISPNFLLSFSFLFNFAFLINMPILGTTSPLFRLSSNWVEGSSKKKINYNDTWMTV